MKSKAEYEELKEEEQSLLSKVGSLLYKIFLGERNIDLEINRTVVSNTYIQVHEIGFLRLLRSFTL